MTIPVTQVSNTQTFGAWLATTNRLADIISTNTVTTDSTAGGSLTTGNSFVNGHFGAAFVYVANTLVGGNVSSNGVLNIQANLAVTNGVSNVLTVTANSSTSNLRITTTTVSILPTGNTTITGNTFVVNTSNVLFTSGSINFNGTPLSGNITFSSNTTYSGSVIIANGSFGANGTVIYSNGTGMYWGSIPTVTGNSGIIANNDGVFVNANNGLVANSTGLFVLANSGMTVNSTGIFVNANNGLVANSTGVFVAANNGLTVNSTGVFVLANNGVSTNSTGVFVTAGTGTVVNATGVHVNAAYINTISSNSATYANASISNTFTVGTSAYFVSNGNVGLGTSSPSYDLDVYNSGTTTTSILVRNDVVGHINYVGSDFAVVGTSTNHRLLMITNNAERIRIDASGNVGIGNSSPQEKLKVAGTIADSSGDVRTVPINAKTSTYQLASTDAGLCISTNAAITVNGAVLSSGFVASVYNNSAASITITQGSGVTMYLAGSATTGNRTVAQRGLITVLCTASNNFVISGTGLT